MAKKGNGEGTIYYSETLKKLLGQLKSKPKKTSSIKKSLINDSYSSSNSSEIGDDRESEENKSNKDNKEYNNISPKKNQNLKRVMTHENKKKISIKKSNNKLELFKAFLFDTIFNKGNDDSSNNLFLPFLFNFSFGRQSFTSIFFLFVAIPS